MKQKSKEKALVNTDRIEGDRIILYDNSTPGPRVLKEIEIITPRSTRIYKIKKTRKCGYLFN
jgi:hypothetical protein